MNIGYIHTLNPSDTSFFHQEKALLDLHCDRILIDEGRSINGLIQAIETCGVEDHLFCLPLEHIVSSPDLREKIYRLMRAKRIDITTIH